MLSVSNEPNDFKSLFLFYREFNRQFWCYVSLFLLYLGSGRCYIFLYLNFVKPFTLRMIPKSMWVSKCLRIGYGEFLIGNNLL